MKPQTNKENLVACLKAYNQDGTIVTDDELFGLAWDYIHSLEVQIFELEDDPAYRLGFEAGKSYILNKF